ncbi:MAG TPA: cell division ATP-binding protein FtsE [Clostridiales bacterium]|nr:cell division ATP-binding protein FtsE [Clostridiales bacterium]
MIEMNNVTKVYNNGAMAIDNISLKVHPGEFVFLIGPSGSGKSTMIKILMREEKVTNGDVFVNGRDVSSMFRSEIPYLRRSMGVVFQDFRLLEKKTLYDNVAFAMEIIGAYKREIKKRVPVVLKMVGLGDKKDCYPGQLSGGEQQRAALARAIVNKPQLLIADEPTGNLDPETSSHIMTLLEEINAGGTTILVATHDINMVNKMEKRVIELSCGRIVRDDMRGHYRNEA